MPGPRNRRDIEEKKEVLEHIIQHSTEAAERKAQEEAARAEEEAAQAEIEEEIRLEREGARREEAHRDAYMDYGALSPYNNPFAREEIEGRCDPISFARLLQDDHLTQLVPIYPGALEVEFETLTKEESDQVTSLALDEVSELVKEKQKHDPGWKIPPMTINRIMVTYNVAGHLFSYNGMRMPPITDRSGGGGFSRVNFEKRLKQVKSRPEVVINILMANVRWFTDRVDRASRVGLQEALGNG